MPKSNAIHEAQKEFDKNV